MNANRTCTCRAAFVVVSLFIAGCGRPESPASDHPGRVLTRSNGDPIVSVASGDPEMDAAIKHAHDTLDTFIAELKQSRKDAMYLVKARLPTDDGGGEHIWLDNLIYDGKGFTGKLTDEPNAVRGMHKGQTFHVRRE